MRLVGIISTTGVVVVDIIPLSEQGSVAAAPHGCHLYFQKPLNIAREARWTLVYDRQTMPTIASSCERCSATVSLSCRTCILRA